METFGALIWKGASRAIASQTIHSSAGLSLKPSAKFFGKHFACGAAVSKQSSGGKAIVIQGDFQMEVPAILRSKFKVKFYYFE